MWSKRVRIVPRPSPAPNVALEATGHSAGFFPVCVSMPVVRASAWALGPGKKRTIWKLPSAIIPGPELL
jgi:hypothetical protein